MFIKPVVNGIVGLVAFSAASVALAGTVITTYAGDDSYYSPAPIPIATVSPFATDQGFVIGVQGGYADTHWDNLNGFGR